MDSLDLIKELSQTSASKIILCVLDGVGGLPHPDTGKTELETARTPNMDKLASQGVCGLADTVGRGITPGSAPGHLALFGYNPLKYIIGRGVLEATGIGFSLETGDVAARGNFCTVDDVGLITDRRAGRISNEKCIELCGLLDGMVIDDIKVMVRPVREHRFVAVFRGSGLEPEVSESDPQNLGVAPHIIIPLWPEADKMADIANKFIDRLRETLAGHHPANMALLRGFSQKPNFATVGEVYKLKPAAISVYPMYRGLAGLLGMEVLKPGDTIQDEFATLKQNYADYDFFFLHIKWTDSCGEDGDFDKKVQVIEEFDRALTQIMNNESDVIIITSDHSTPATLKGHSWHPVPVLLHSKWARTDKVQEFSESACVTGGLGRFPATQIMHLAMAHALKLIKFGA